MELWAAVGGGFWPWSAWFSLGLVAVSHQLGTEYRISVTSWYVYYLIYSFLAMAKNFKLHFAHRFDGTRRVQNVFLKLLRHSTNSDACLAKKTDENSDGKLPRNDVQNSKMHFGTKWTVSSPFSSDTRI